MIGKIPLTIALDNKIVYLVDFQLHFLHFELAVNSLLLLIPCSCFVLPLDHKGSLHC